MKLYKIVIMLFGFSLFVTASSQMGIFSAPVPSQNLSMSQTTITQITNTQSQTNNGGLFSLATDAMDTIWWFGQSVKVVSSSIGAILTLGGTLSAYGIPTPIVTMIMGMLTLVSAYGLIQWVTGRMNKGME